MTKSAYALKLPPSVKEAAARLAKDEGISLNQWITLTIAQKIASVETTRDALKRYAAGAKPGDLLAILDRIPDAPPVPGDELPDDLREALDRT